MLCRATSYKKLCDRWGDFKKHLINVWSYWEKDHEAEDSNSGTTTYEESLKKIWEEILPEVYLFDGELPDIVVFEVPDLLGDLESLTFTNPTLWWELAVVADAPHLFGLERDPRQVQVVRPKQGGEENRKSLVEELFLRVSRPFKKPTDQGKGERQKEELILPDCVFVATRPLLARYFEEELHGHETRLGQGNREGVLEQLAVTLLAEGLYDLDSILPWVEGPVRQSLLPQEFTRLCAKVARIMDLEPPKMEIDEKGETGRWPIVDPPRYTMGLDVDWRSLIPYFVAEHFLPYILEQPWGASSAKEKEGDTATLLGGWRGPLPANVVDFLSPWWPEYLEMWIKLLIKRRKSAEKDQEGKGSKKTLKLLSRMKHWYYLYCTYYHILDQDLRFASLREHLPRTPISQGQDQSKSAGGGGDYRFSEQEARSLRGLQHKLQSVVHGYVREHGIYGDLLNPPYLPPLSLLVSQILPLWDLYSSKREKGQEEGIGTTPRARFVWVDNDAVDIKLLPIIEVMLLLSREHLIVRPAIPWQLAYEEFLRTSQGLEPPIAETGEIIEKIQRFVKESFQESFKKEECKMKVNNSRITCFKVGEEVRDFGTVLEIAWYKPDKDSDHSLHKACIEGIICKAPDLKEDEQEHVFLLLDFVLASKQTGHHEIYLADDFLRDLVKSKNKMLLEVIEHDATGNKRLATFEPQWVTVVSKHQFNTLAYIDSGRFSMEYGQVLLHPGEDPIHPARLAPFLLKLLGLMHSRRKMLAQLVYEAVGRAILACNAMEAKADTSTYLQLRVALANLYAALQEAKNLLAPRGRARFNTRDEVADMIGDLFTAMGASKAFRDKRSQEEENKAVVEEAAEFTQRVLAAIDQIVYHLDQFPPAYIRTSLDLIRQDAQDFPFFVRVVDTLTKALDEPVK